MARIAACMKTNKSKKYIHDKFLEKASNYFSELFKTDIQVGCYEDHSFYVPYHPNNAIENAPFTLTQCWV